MFQLSVISDLISIPSSAFNVPVRKAVLNELNTKYANKVIHKLGLVVTVWDVLEIDDGMLRPGDGASYVKVKFRCVVWKPFVGEVITGWIEKCTTEGIKVKLEFFNDIFIPKNYLFENCNYSELENAWIWTPEEGTNLYLDVNEKINFRIEEEIFTNIKPKGPNNDLTSVAEKKEDSDNDDEDDNKGRVPPYAIIASCQTDGMGCVNWWE